VHTNTLDTVIGPEKIVRKKKEYLIPCVYHFYKEPMQIVQGKGQYLHDHEGRQYLDCYSGVSVVNAGHCHPYIVDRICEQALDYAGRHQKELLLRQWFGGQRRGRAVGAASYGPQQNAGSAPWPARANQAGNEPDRPILLAHRSDARRRCRARGKPILLSVSAGSVSRLLRDRVRARNRESYNDGHVRARGLRNPVHLR